MQFIPASAVIILGYPGEIAVDTAPKAIWGALSTIPFLYILYILFVELTKATKTVPGQVARTSTVFAGCFLRRGAFTPSRT